MRVALGSLLLLASAVAHAQPAPAGAPPPTAGSDTAAEPLPTAPPFQPEQDPPTPQRLVAPPQDPPTVTVHPTTATADDWTLHPGGFLQPAFRLRQQSPGAPDETDGFRLVRARITATGAGHVGPLQVSSYFEAELQPSFSLFDAYVTLTHALPRAATISLDLGQMRVPISRQQLISDTRLSFVEKAQLGSIAPDRDLGARLTVAIPHARLMLGSFNGEGRDQGQNINNSFLTAARLEVTPIGEQAPYAESAFGGTFLSVGGSVGFDKLSPGAYHENLTYLGVDVSGAWHGLSGSFEYLQVGHHFADATGGVMLQPDYQANGFVAQVAYLLPVRLGPAHAARLEIGARVEEIDRNDTTPIVQAGDPNQSSRIFTAVVSYYLREHRMKVQLAASHYTELEDRTATGADATYPNDQLLLQLTYRLE